MLTSVKSGKVHVSRLLVNGVPPFGVGLGLVVIISKAVSLGWQVWAAGSLVRAASLVGGLGALRGRGVKRASGEGGGGGSFGGMKRAGMTTTPERVPAR